MKQPNIPDYSKHPCKSIIAENIQNVKNNKELTAPLSYLNKSCEFRTAYRRIVGEFEKMDEQEFKAHRKAYNQRPEVKARERAYKKAYYQRKKAELKEVKE